MVVNSYHTPQQLHWLLAMSINNIFLSVDNVFTIASQLQYNGKINNKA